MRAAKEPKRKVLLFSPLTHTQQGTIIFKTSECNVKDFFFRSWIPLHERRGAAQAQLWRGGFCWFVELGLRQCFGADSRELLLPAGIARPAFMKPSSAPKPAGAFSPHRSCRSFVLLVGWINLQQGLWSLQRSERLRHHGVLKNIYFEDQIYIKIYIWSVLKHHWAKTFSVLHPCLFVLHMSIPAVAQSCPSLRIFCRHVNYQNDKGELLTSFLITWLL